MMIVNYKSKKELTEKMVNSLEALTRRQQKFDQDQKDLKEAYAKTLNDLRIVQTNFQLDISQFKSANLGYTIAEMETMFNKK